MKQAIKFIFPVCKDAYTGVDGTVNFDYKVIVSQNLFKCNTVQLEVSLYKIIYQVVKDLWPLNLILLAGNPC